MRLPPQDRIWSLEADREIRDNTYAEIDHTKVGLNDLSLQELLLRRVEKTHDRRDFIFLESDGTGSLAQTELTSAELASKARSVALQLQQLCERGSRVAIICNRSADFLVGFYGCQLAGVVAVPVEPPQNASTLARAKLIFNACTPDVVLTNASLSSTLADGGVLSGHSASLLTIEDASEPNGSEFNLVRSDPSKPAWLQFNCEVAGLGKGVLISHKAAIAQCLGIAERISITSDSVCGVCLPLTHNMGLVAAALMPVVIGSPCVTMATEAFVACPSDWLKEISDRRISHITAPAFVYRLATLALTEPDIEHLDLSNIKTALCGGEVAATEVLSNFSRKFAAAGLPARALAPSFGLREAVSMITGCPSGSSAKGAVLRSADAWRFRLDTSHIVSGDEFEAAVEAGEPLYQAAGQALADHDLKVVDPNTRRELTNGAIGEIWVSGLSTGSAYLDDPEATRSRFHGRLADDSGGTRYLRSGYMGAVVDGELYPVMSLDGAVSIRGTRFSPDEIEQELERAVPDVGQGRTVVLPLRDENREGIVVIHERPDDAACHRAGLEKRIRQAAAGSFKISVEEFAVLPCGALPRTASGTPNRYRTRYMYVSGVWSSDPGDAANDGRPGSIRHRAKNRAVCHQRNTLLGTAFESASTGERIYQRSLSLPEAPWMGEHRLFGLAVLPGVTPVSMAFEAAGPRCSVRNILLSRPVILQDDVETTHSFQFSVTTKDSPSALRFLSAVRSSEADGWRKAAEGEIHLETHSQIASLDVQSVVQSLTEYPTGEISAACRRANLEFGPRFDALAKAYSDGNRSLTEIRLPEMLAGEMEETVAHPVLLDAAIRFSADLLDLADGHNENGEDSEFWAPWRIEGVSLTQKIPDRFFAFVSNRGEYNEQRDNLTLSIDLYLPDGVSFGRIDRLTYRKAPKAALLQAYSEQAAAISGASLIAGSAELRDRLATIDETRWEGEILLFLQEEIRDSLGLTDSPAADAGLFDLGLSSLKAVELTARLSNALGPDISIENTIAFDHSRLSQLAAYIRGLLSETNVGKPLDTPPIAARGEQNGSARASIQQEALWFLAQTSRSSSVAYNVWVSYRVRGELDLSALEKAVRCVIARHDALRTTLICGEDGLRQILHDAARDDSFELEVSDLDDKELNPEDIARNLGETPLDLSDGPLFRMHVRKCRPNDYVVVLAGHHSVLDGYSFMLIGNELQHFYSKFRKGLPADLPPPAIQYGDYAEWQNEVATGERYQQSLSYWNEALRDLPTVVSLPTDRPRPAQLDYSSGNIPFHLQSEIYSELVGLARMHNTTSFILLETLFAAFIQKIGGDTDFVVGVPGAGRVDNVLAKSVGCFVDVLPIRHRIDPAQSILQLVRNSAGAITAAMKHQIVPFAEIVKAVAPPRSAQHTPISQVGLVFQPQGVDGLSGDFSLPDVHTDLIAADTGGYYDLALRVRETDQGLEGDFAYSKQLFDLSTVRQLSLQFQAMCRFALQNPDVAIDGIPLEDEPTPCEGGAAHRDVAQTNGAVTQKPAPATLADQVKNESLDADEEDFEKTVARAFADLLSPYFEDQGLPTDTGGNALKAIDLEDIIKPESDFFALGGHSLLAVRLVNRLTELTGRELRINDVVGEATVAAIAANLAKAALKHPKEAPGEDRLDAFELIAPGLAEQLPFGLQDAFPMSSAQQGMLYHSHKSAGAGLYVNVFTYLFELPLDLALLTSTLQDLGKRHTMLRSSLSLTHGDPLLFVHRSADIPLDFEDVSGRDENWQRAYVEDFVRRQALTDFDLASPPLIRTFAHQLGPERFALTLTFHHAILDGWSVAALLGEWIAHYAAERQGAKPHRDTSPPRYSFGSHVKEERDAVESTTSEEFWSKAICDAELSELPKLSRNDSEEGYKSERVDINSSLTADVRDLALGLGVSIKSVLLSAFLRVVGLHSSTWDVTVGLATGGRPEIDGAERLLGMFVNLVPVRAEFGPNDSWATLIRSAHEFEKALMPHRRYPYARIQRLNGDKSLFECVFNFLHLENYKALAEAGLEPNQCELLFKAERPDFPLYLNAAVHPVRNTLEAELFFDPSLFAPWQMESFAQHYIACLSEMTSRPEGAPLTASFLMGTHLDSASETERSTPPGIGKSLVDAFADQVAKQPDKPALIDGDTTISYRELDSASNRLARLLIQRGVTREAIVGVSLERSSELVIALLAVLKSGGAYLPLDPAYPDDRVAFMVSDASAELVITGGKRRPELSGKNGNIDLHADNIRQEMLDMLDAPVTDEERGQGVLPDQLCYIMYTSGSTGRPKGTPICHRNVVSLLLSTDDWYRFSSDDTWTLFHSYAFDFSVWEIFGALCFGGRLVIVPKRISQSPAAFRELLARENVTVLNQTPTAFLNLVSEEQSHSDKLTALRVVIFGGERLEPVALSRWFEKYRYDQPRLVNMYGITETTVHVSYSPVTAEMVETGTSVIGEAIPGLRVYVVDRYLDPVPVGVAGELLVGGDQVGRGYHRRAGLTAQRFIPDHISGRSGDRLYRSGDLARRLPDGTLEYLGRMDDQIKIRGMRVELAEIETVLASCRGVEQGIAYLSGEGSESKLAACIVPDKQELPLVGNQIVLEQSGRLDRSKGLRLPDGLFVSQVNPSETRFVWEEIFAGRVYSRAGVALRDNAVVIDLGAHIGLFTLFCSKACWNPRIISVEPIPSTFHHLELNCELHDVDAELLQAAIGCETGTIALTSYENVSVMSGAFADADEDRKTILEFLDEGEGSEDSENIDAVVKQRLKYETVEARCITLSDLIDEYGLSRIDLLKIDIEKSEEDALKGIREEHWPLIDQLAIEVHNIGDRQSRIEALLRENGFRVSVVKDDDFTSTRLSLIYATRRPADVGDLALRQADYEFPVDIESWFEGIRSELAAKLPEHMVPAGLLARSELPLTASGKIDRTALSRINPEYARAEYIAPESPTEWLVANAFSSVLEVGQVSLNDDFFDLGGHSLLAIQVVANLGRALNRDVPLDLLFDASTVSDFAASIDRNEAVRPREPEIQLVRLDREARLSACDLQLPGFYLSEAARGHAALNLVASFDLDPTADLVRLSSAVDTVLMRNEVLRTRYHKDADGHFAIVDEPSSGALVVHELAKLNAPAFDDAVQMARRRPIDLQNGPILRAEALVGAERFVVVLGAHHAVIDAQSLRLMASEIVNAYERRDADVAPKHFEYLEFSDYYNRVLETANEEDLKKYWSEYLEGCPVFMALPSDRPIGQSRSRNARRLHRTLDPAAVSKIRQRVVELKVTPFVILQSCLAVLLGHLTDSDDIVLGGVSDMRRRPEFEHLIGLCTKVTPTRFELPAEKTISEFLTGNRERWIESLKHDRLPFEKIVEAVNPPRFPDLHPIYQVFAQYIAGDVDEGTSGELQLGVQRTDYDEPGGAIADVGFDFVQTEDGISLSASFDTDLFDPETMEAFLAAYTGVLNLVTQDVHQTLRDVSDALLSATDELADALSYFDALRANSNNVGCWYEADLESSNATSGTELAKIRQPETSLFSAVMPHDCDTWRLAQAIQTASGKMQNARSKIWADQLVARAGSMANLDKASTTLQLDEARLASDYVRRWFEGQYNGADIVPATQWFLAKGSEGVVVGLRAADALMDRDAVDAIWNDVCDQYGQRAEIQELGRRPV